MTPLSQNLPESPLLRFLPKCSFTAGRASRRYQPAVKSRMLFMKFVQEREPRKAVNVAFCATPSLGSEEAFKASRSCYESLRPEVFCAKGQQGWKMVPLHPAPCGKESGLFQAANLQ